MPIAHFLRRLLDLQLHNIWPWCGRYRRTTQEEELARLYHIPIPRQTDLPISYNIAPSQKVLTMRFKSPYAYNSPGATSRCLVR